MERQLLSCLLLRTTLSFAQLTPAYYWKLDEANGTTAPSALNGTDGILAGGVTWDPSGGHFQGAARFDGVDDRILLGACDVSNGGQALGLSLWIKPDFVTGMERTLIAKTVGPQLDDHVWSIALVNATALRFRLKAGGITTELSTPPSSLFGGTWYHMVAVYDGSEMRLYANGALMANTPKGGSIGYHPQSPASIGATSTGTEPFSGWIDEVRIYDVALTDADVIDILFESGITHITEEASLWGASSLQRILTAHQEVLITDVMGRTIASSSFNNTSAVDLPLPPAGSYLVCLQDHGVRRTIRVVVP